MYGYGFCDRHHPLISLLCLRMQYSVFQLSTRIILAERANSWVLLRILLSEGTLYLHTEVFPLHLSCFPG